jgi:ribosomal protein S18 acetylase RimI-like enzyme
VLARQRRCRASLSPLISQLDVRACAEPRLAVLKLADPSRPSVPSRAFRQTHPLVVVEVRRVTDEDREWTTAYHATTWGGPLVARRGQLVDTSHLAALVALLDGERAGLLAYAIRGEECEVVTLATSSEGRGVGRALLDAIRQVAETAGCRRLWLITTNNNLRALKLYQRWGMELVALHRDAVRDARRRLKPEIPERDSQGIPIAHELELELCLAH